jgi:hypothetical protein
MSNEKAKDASERQPTSEENGSKPEASEHDTPHACNPSGERFGAPEDVSTSDIHVLDRNPDGSAHIFVARTPQGVAVGHVEHEHAQNSLTMMRPGRPAMVNSAAYRDNWESIFGVRLPIGEG